MRAAARCWPASTDWPTLALRTLAVAYLPPGEERPPEEEWIERDLVYLGMVGIIDPPRPEARAAIEEAHARGHPRRDDHR